MDRYLAILSTIAEDVIPVGHAKIAAAIVYKGEILSIGVCSYKTHPFQKMNGRNPMSIHKHAEIDALIKCQSKIRKRGISLKKCTMYIARVKRPNAMADWYVPGLAKPCDGCMRAIQEAGITKIIHTEN